MLRSKSRSGVLDVGAKHHSSIVSRTLSSSRICRGDPLIHKNALVSIDKRPSAKIISSSENQIVRVSTMQRRMGLIEEELKLTKDQLDAAEEDRDRALGQLQESKMMVHEANSRFSEALSPRKAEKVFAELNTVKELLSNSQKELAAKEENIESMKLELDQAKQSENKLADKVSSLSRLEDELRIARISETRAMELCSESRKRIAVLEDELEKRNQSENEVSESGVSQTKELEAAKMELQESKLQIISLREQLQNLQSSSAVSNREQNGVKKSDHVNPKIEPSLPAGDPQSEIDVLKKQLKAALEGEEHSTKAMNDLALALNEVATESNHTKEQLISTETELEHVKEQAEQLKIMVRSIEDEYQKLLTEEKKETELHKNTADRLRVEAEESFLAWHGKEIGFVNVIKEVEEEKVCTQQENVKLAESLKTAEDTSRKAREENHKLRDVLKQALNESNVAKEAASIAQAENSELKDSLAEMEETLDSLTRENDKLRISDAAANEKIKELNRLLSQAHAGQKTDYKDPGTGFMSPASFFDDYEEDYSKQHMEDYSKQHREDYSNNMIDQHENDTANKKGFSFDLHQVKLHNKFEDEDDTLVDEDPVKAEALKGSIFDPDAETPKSEAPKPKLLAPKLHLHPHHHHHLRKKSTSSNAETLNSDDLNHLDNDSNHDSEGTHDKEDYSKQEDFSKQPKKAVAVKKGFSFDLHTIKLQDKSEDEDDTRVDEDPEKDETLKGSIFDPSTETPKSEARKPKLLAPKHHHHYHLRKKSSSSNVETLNTDDLNHIDGDSNYDSEGTHYKEDYSKQEDYGKHKKAFSFDLRRHKEDNSKQDKEAAAIKKGFSFDLHKMKLPNKVDDEDEDDTPVDEDPVKAETIKGSIFDPSTEKPKGKPKLLVPKHHHHLRKKSSSSNVGTLNSDVDSDSNHDCEGTHSDESSQRRKKSAALKNFGYLLMRKNFTQHTSHAKKESS